MSAENGPYRPDEDGTARVHVMSEKCSTCVFRSGNLMHLNEGRLADMVKSNLAEDTGFACHQTLSYGEYEVPGEAICRGFYDAYGDEVTPLRLATAMGLVTEQEPPTEKRQS